MDADHVADKRARLLTSKTKWSEIGGITATQPFISAQTEKYHQDSINQWHSRVTDEHANQENVREYAASLYDKTTPNTVQESLSTHPERPLLTSAWNSLTSGISSHSGPHSAMDALTLWQDDPEELLLDLGFGAEEPDITVKIPARFINHQSQARGINLQVFLEAQQNRIDIENPDVRNRFRQIEVLQQVTTAFTSLVGGVVPGAERPVESQISEEARVRRKRVGMLFRNASKKSLSQLASSRAQHPLSPSLADQSSSPELPGDVLEKRIPLKRANLSPLVEEQTFVSEEAESTETTTLPQVKSSSPTEGRELKNVTSAINSARGGTGVPVESFELEEIQSFDEGSIGGTCTGTPDQQGNERAYLTRVRTNSCQSDSSGFLEEPFVPACPNPGPELMKVLNAMSGDSTESPQKSEDLQETAIHSSSIQDSDKLLKQTDPSATDSNIHTAKGPAHTGMKTSTGDTTKRDLQDTNRTDYLVIKEVVQKDIVDVCVRESTTLQKDSLGLCDYGANTLQSTTLKKDSPGLCDYSAKSIKSTTLQKDSSGLCDYSASTVQSNTLQKDSPALHDYNASTMQNITLPKDSPGLGDFGTNTIPSTTLQKESQVLNDYGFGESLKFQKNSLNQSHYMVVGGGSQMEKQKSDVSVFKSDSSSTDPKAGTEKVPSSTEGYYGRSVSVQMCSNLTSQSSLRGSISHSSLTGNSPTSDVQLRRVHMEQFDSDVTNNLDNAQSTNTPTTKAHTLPNPWHPPESSKGPRSTSLDKGRSYEEDTRWEAALWSGAQSCSSCGHKQQCCCQNKNSEKKLHPASSLPYSMEELIGMMRCMWKFRKMLAEIEERLEEEQELVNSSFSDEHREEVQDILKLRTAVKKESEMFEQQLNDLVQAYDDNLQMKMNNLLDEQSHLCTQLRFTHQPGRISKKSVGIQCTLLTDSPESCLSTQLTDDTRLIHNTKWSPDSKADKLDFVGFIKSLKDGIHEQ